jgi:type IV secretion system protein VirB9
MTIKRELITLGCCMLLTSQSYALQATRSLPQDHRIKVVSYEPNNVVPILGTTFNTTQIIFDKDEFIENLQSGDPAAWSVNVQQQIPYMLFLKPTLAGSNTNLMVITTKRTYYFQLKSVDAEHLSSKQQTYAIRFTYPEEEAAQQVALMKKIDTQKKGQLNPAQNPQFYNWDYSFHGDKTLIPLHVFDDGQFTYFELRPGQSISAVFSVDNVAGKESIVNFRREGQYVVVQQRAPQFTLRNGGEHVASIFNNRLIRQV